MRKRNEPNGKKCPQNHDQIDLVDTKLLQEITVNPAISLKDLAKTVGLNPPQVARRKSRRAFQKGVRYCSV